MKSWIAVGGNFPYKTVLTCGTVGDVEITAFFNDKCRCLGEVVWQSEFHDLMKTFKDLYNIDWSARANLKGVNI